MATDVFLYAGEANPNDVRLRDPAIQAETASEAFYFYMERCMQAYRTGRRMMSRSKR